MKNKIINLTPLLDIILILLFGFMINVKAQNKQFQSSKIKELENQKQYSAQLEKKIVEYQRQNENLKLNRNAIENRNQILQKEIKRQKAEFDEFKEQVRKSRDNLAKALADFFETKADDFADDTNELNLISRKELKEQLSELSKKNRVIKALLKFYAFSRHFYTLDIRIAENNILYINNSSTNEKPSSAEQVYSLISEYIDMAKDRNHGMEKMIIMWSYGKDATISSTEKVELALDKLRSTYGPDDIILAQCGYIPEE